MSSKVLGSRFQVSGLAQIAPAPLLDYGPWMAKELPTGEGKRQKEKMNSANQFVLLYLQGKLSKRTTFRRLSALLSAGEITGDQFASFVGGYRLREGGGK